MIEIKRPVFFSGENPGMTLLVPDSGEITAAASYWVCTDSPAGIGHALVLWLAAETAELGHGCIFTDNRELARVLVQNLTQHFPEFETIPVGTLPYVEADCGHKYDGERYEVLCQAANLRVELAWINVLDRKQVIWPGFPAGQVSFDLTTVICPCRRGTIQINDRVIGGQVKVTQAEDGEYSSTAFLAFAETWIGPLDEKTE
ncbi:MAG: hypothetical protein JEZ00_21955 [Anaerolineaceae bacterium]|nr:hypothetical protein [Anaerolineaceae bacterium]